jgi:hypothetical protein
MEGLMRKFICNNLMVLWHLVKRTWYADCESLYMALNKHPNSGMKSLLEL